MKALFIDDEAYILNLVENYFKIFGIKLDCSLSAQEGLTLIDGSTYSILFVDYNLPDIELSFFLEEVRRKNKKIIIVIESGEDESYISLPDLENIHFLKKPFSIYDLRDKIIEIFPEVEINKLDKK